jgi:hypothetical protein
MEGQKGTKETIRTKETIGTKRTMRGQKGTENNGSSNKTKK